MSKDVSSTRHKSVGRLYVHNLPLAASLTLLTDLLASRRAVAFLSVFRIRSADPDCEYPSRPTSCFVTILSLSRQGWYKNNVWNNHPAFQSLEAIDNKRWRAVAASLFNQKACYWQDVTTSAVGGSASVGVSTIIDAVLDGLASNPLKLHSPTLERMKSRKKDNWR